MKRTGFGRGFLVSAGKRGGGFTALLWSWGQFWGHPETAAFPELPPSTAYLDTRFRPLSHASSSSRCHLPNLFPTPKGLAAAQPTAGPAGYLSVVLAHSKTPSCETASTQSPDVGVAVMSSDAGYQKSDHEFLKISHCVCTASSEDHESRIISSSATCRSFIHAFIASSFSLAFNFRSSYTAERLSPAG